MTDRLDIDGFALVHGVLSAAACAEWIAALGPVAGAGRRGVLREPAVGALARSEALLSRVRAHLACEPRPVRGILFDKTPDSNWLVPWHQDLTLAVRSRIDLPGFGPWST